MNCSLTLLSNLIDKSTCRIVHVLLLFFFQNKTIVLLCNLDAFFFFKFHETFIVRIYLSWFIYFILKYELKLTGIFWFTTKHSKSNSFFNHFMTINRWCNTCINLKLTNYKRNSKINLFTR